MKLVSSLGSNGGVDLLSVLVEANTRRRSSDTATSSGSDADDLAVDGARDAVVSLEVELGKSVLLVDGSLRDITDGSSLNHVSDNISLDSLVLGNHSGAVGAADRGDVASALLVTSVGSSLLRHFDLERAC